MKELPPVKRLAHAIALLGGQKRNPVLGGVTMTRYPCKGCPELSGCTKTGDCPQWYAWFCEILDEICKEKEIEKAHNKKERRKKK